MKYRNRLPLDPPALGEKLLTKMTQLDIKMLRFADESGDRSIMCDFVITGHLRPDDLGQGDAPLLKALLVEFLDGSGGDEDEPPAESGVSHEE